MRRGVLFVVASVVGSSVFACVDLGALEGDGGPGSHSEGGVRLDGGGDARDGSVSSDAQSDGAEPHLEGGLNDAVVVEEIPIMARDGAPAPGAGCPSSQSLVAAGGECSPAGIECEYGTSPAPQCNTIYQCELSALSGKADWKLLHFPSTTECPPGCPADYDDIENDAGCSPDYLACSYSSKGICFCAESSVSSAYLWSCTAATTSCPAPRPDLGTPCTGPVTCDYNACGGGLEMTCSGSYWEIVTTGCP